MEIGSIRDNQIGEFDVWTELEENKAGQASTVSIIIINPGPGAALGRTFDALTNQVFSDFEVIMAAPLGKTEPFAPLAEKWPRTVILTTDEDLGFCRAANLAAERATGKYMLFLDHNAWLNQTTLEKLVEVLESEPETSIVGPLLLNPNGSLHSIGMNLDRFGQPLVNRETFGADTEIIDNIFFVPGNVMMVEKRLFVALKGFDEFYDQGLADADLCWRARLLGRKVVVNPWSIAYSAPSARYESDLYFKHRNSLRMLIKNYGALRALRACAGYLKTTIVKSLRSLISLNPGVFVQYWRALVWNVIVLPDSIRQRRWVQRRRRHNDKQVLEHIWANNEKTDNVSKDRAA